MVTPWHLTPADVARLVLLCAPGTCPRCDGASGSELPGRALNDPDASPAVPTDTGTDAR